MKNAHEDFDSSKIDWLETIEEIHSIADDSGFWESMDGVLKKMRNFDNHGVSTDFFTEDEIIQVKKAFITQKIMLIVTELSESVESDRKSKVADWDKYAKHYKQLGENSGHKKEYCFKWAFEGYIKDSFEDEIADAVIRIFDLCAKMEIDIIKHIRYKMEYNETRDKLHGKEY